MIALIDYGAGNLRSVQNALTRLSMGSLVASRPDDVAEAEAIIFPGVGAAGPAMLALREQGIDTAILSAIRRGVPFLGICLGLQLLFERSAEDGTTCLGAFPGTVERLNTREKLPHVGWNTIATVRPHPVLEGIDGEAMYFVHSYVAVPRNPALVVGETTHGVPFVSVIGAGRLVGVQFHPERSGPAGLRVLENFVHFANLRTTSAA